MASLPEDVDTYYDQKDVEESEYESDSLIKSTESSSRRSWQKSIRFPILLLLSNIVILVTTLAWCGHYPSVTRKTETTSTSIQIPPSRIPKIVQEADCGASPAEARDGGCMFDVMTNAWLPQECYNEALTESWLAANDHWKWYSDRNKTDEVPLETLRLGEYTTVWTSLDWHYKHCIFDWQKVLIALEQGGPYDLKSVEPGHATHCGERLLERGELDDLTEVVIGFLPCKWVE